MVTAIGQKAFISQAEVQEISRLQEKIKAQITEEVKKNEK
jgi:hypothetical protein